VTHNLLGKKYKQQQQDIFVKNIPIINKQNFSSTPKGYSFTEKKKSAAQLKQNFFIDPCYVYDLFRRPDGYKSFD
jgi:hypothetical protein